MRSRDQQPIEREDGAMSGAHRQSVTTMQSKRYARRRGWREAFGFAIAALALAAMSAQSVFAADGSDVVDEWERQRGGEPAARCHAGPGRRP